MLLLPGFPDQACIYIYILIKPQPLARRLRNWGEVGAIVAARAKLLMPPFRCVFTGHQRSMRVFISISISSWTWKTLATTVVVIRVFQRSRRTVRYGMVPRDLQSERHDHIYIYQYTKMNPSPCGPGIHLGVNCGLADVRPRRDGCCLKGLACRDTCPANGFAVAGASSFSFRTEFRKSSLLLFLATHPSLLSSEMCAWQYLYIYTNEVLNTTEVMSFSQSNLSSGTLVLWDELRKATQNLHHVGRWNRLGCPDLLQECIYIYIKPQHNTPRQKSV